MKPPSDQEIAAALAEMRPVPRPQLARELDERVASGFSRPSRPGRFDAGRLLDRLRSVRPGRLATLGAAVGLVAVIVATSVIAGAGSNSKPGPVALGRGT